MTIPKRYIREYKQAPWRKQTQRGAALLLTAILGASILWVMLSVTVQAGAVGLRIQFLQSNREDLRRSIANLNTHYAELTSSQRMSKRAKELGFEPIKPENITYMIIPGYTGRPSKIDVGMTAAEAQAQAIIKPAYSQSLWEWAADGLFTMENQAGSVIP